MTLLAPRLKTSTHCPYCSLQCGMDLAKGDGGLTVTPNGGGLCQKGWTSVELLSHPQRLTAPLMRAERGAPLLEVEWDVALDRIAGEFRAVARQHGPDGVGVFGGGGLTNEKAYALGKFARVALRTASIDYNGRFCMSSAAAAGTFAFGLDRGLPFPLADIARADVLLLVGSNLAETMPPAVAHLDDQQLGGGRLIVVDPRASPTARRADLHLQIAPGTDLALALGLLHIVLKEDLVDAAFVARRTDGFERAAQRAGAYWPDRVERICGVPVELLRRTAHLLAEGPRSMILTGRGPEQQSQGSDTVSGFINLALALGMPGRAGSGYGCLTGQGNGQGGREHGQKADQLPGYRRIDDPVARAHVAAVWDVDPDTLPGPGRSAYELLDTLGIEGGVHALLVMGSNVVVSAPHAGHVQERVDALDFLAVSDLFLSETAARADVVLPVAQWAEEDGTMTNLEGRVILRRAAVAPPAGVRTDLEVLSALAARLGCPAGFPTDPETVFDELRRASAGGTADYAGISYARIAREGGTFWPCPQETAPDAPRMFLERFATDDGRARFRPVNYKPPVEPPDAAYPLWLTTGRVLRHYQSGTQTRRVAALNAAEPEPFVELHPVLARRHRIADGDPVAIASRRGEAIARARITPDIRSDTVFMPFHWAGRGRANLLTNPVLDPRSRMPEFKLCAVRIEAARPDPDEETNP